MTEEEIRKIARFVVNRIMDEHPCDCVMYKGKRLSFNREITYHATWLESQLRCASEEAVSQLLEP